MFAVTPPRFELHPDGANSFSQIAIHERWEVQPMGEVAVSSHHVERFAARELRLHDENLVE